MCGTWRAARAPARAPSALPAACPAFCHCGWTFGWFRFARDGSACAPHRCAALPTATHACTTCRRLLVLRCRLVGLRWFTWNIRPPPTCSPTAHAAYSFLHRACCLDWLPLLNDRVTGRWDVCDSVVMVRRAAALRRRDVTSCRGHIHHTIAPSHASPFCLPHTFPSSPLGSSASLFPCHKPFVLVLVIGGRLWRGCERQTGVARINWNKQWWRQRVRACAGNARRGGVACGISGPSHLIDDGLPLPLVGLLRALVRLPLHALLPHAAVGYPYGWLHRWFGARRAPYPHDCVRLVWL